MSVNSIDNIGLDAPEIASKGDKIDLMAFERRQDATGLFLGGHGFLQHKHGQAVFGSHGDDTGRRRCRDDKYNVEWSGIRCRARPRNERSGIGSGSGSENGDTSRRPDRLDCIVYRVHHQ
jgi:hypothetical protein